MKQAFTLFLLLASFSFAIAQGGTVRGTILDAETGEPIIYGNILLEGTDFGANTDLDGFYTINGIPAGTYTLTVSYIGYMPLSEEIEITEGNITTKNIDISASEGVKLETFQVDARREEARTEVQISKVTVSPKQIQSLPSTGGQADLAQYMTVLPGVVSTGDQGGQLYIRGGSPIQNKILLDGMTIYNPFHSIGFFSVFETEAIRSVDVLTGGFSAEYGGRVSAIVDITTREGNRKNFGGNIAVNPFQAKALVEGPIKKYQGPGTGSSSFLLTMKRSIIQETSPTLYDYAINENLYGGEPGGENTVDALPFNFTDVYGKLSFLTGNGSKLNLFGFSFTDEVDYAGVANLSWNNGGGGANFSIIPPNSSTIIGGTVAYSNYDIELNEADGNPRTSSIENYSARLQFTNFGRNNEVQYGFQFQGINTDFRFRNFLGNTVQQENFATELNGFIKYKQTAGNFVFEPSIRLQFYASQPKLRLEPRLGLKLNASDRFRIKFAGGMYSQNILSSVNELDIVNLFVGFLTGPEERIFDFDGNPTSDRLQKAVHAIGGVEIDLTDNLELNIEPYYKGFTQLITLNRNKLIGSDPDFAIETGDARGIDLSLRYSVEGLYIYGTYSLGKVTRDDGEQTFPTIFDRRHNINFLTSYNFGSDDSWEAGVRYNFGTGFPFTLTRGFFGEQTLNDGLQSDVLTGNAQLGILYDERRNQGRLPNYHRLDLSLKKTFEYGERGRVEIVASVTNAANRENIFFFDRIRYERVNQLPILPAIGVNWKF